MLALLALPAARWLHSKSFGWPTFLRNGDFQCVPLSMRPWQRRWASPLLTFALPSASRSRTRRQPGSTGSGSMSQAVDLALRGASTSTLPSSPRARRSCDAMASRASRATASPCRYWDIRCTSSGSDGATAPRSVAPDLAHDWGLMGAAGLLLTNSLLSGRAHVHDAGVSSCTGGPETASLA